MREAPLSGKRIFVVEDNPENRIVTQIALGTAGANLRFDYWGRRTVKKVLEFAPVDLIVMDLMLALGGNGFSVAEDIRAVPELKDIPIVAVSASDPSVAIPACRSAGFRGFIAKPVSDNFPYQLARIINGELIWDE